MIRLVSLSSSTMGGHAIATQGSVKQFGAFTAVDGVSFVVNAGKSYGFLGPNGAGTRTTIGMVTALTVPTAGHAIIGGFDVRSEAAEVQPIAGVALQEIGLDPLMKATDW